MYHEMMKTLEIDRKLAEYLHVEQESRKHVDEYSTSSRFEQVGQNKSIV
jgi:hypothetical protein